MSLQVHEHDIGLHLFRSSLILLGNVSKFSMQRSSDLLSDQSIFYISDTIINYINLKSSLYYYLLLVHIYQFPVATIANYHKLDGLKPQICMFFYFLEAKSSKASCWCAPPDAPEQSPFHASLQAPGDHGQSLACATSAASVQGLTSPSPVCNLPLPPSQPGHLPSFRARLSNSRWYHQILNIITPVKTLFLNKVEFTCSRQGLGHELIHLGSQIWANLQSRSRSP